VVDPNRKLAKKLFVFIWRLGIGLGFLAGILMFYFKIRIDEIGLLLLKYFGSLMVLSTSISWMALRGK